LPATTPVATTGTGTNLTAALGGAQLDTTAGYANIIQVRLVQSGGTNFWASDISYNSAAGTWTQVFPAVVTATTTTLTATPNPAITGQTVTLNAAVSPSGAAGTVQFKDGATKHRQPGDGGQRCCLHHHEHSVGWFTLAVRGVHADRLDVVQRLDRQRHRAGEPAGHADEHGTVRQRRLPDRW